MIFFSPAKKKKIGCVFAPLFSFQAWPFPEVKLLFIISSGLKPPNKLISGVYLTFGRTALDPQHGRKLEKNDPLIEEL